MADEQTDSDQRGYVNKITDGHHENVVMAGVVHGGVHVNHGGDLQSDLADPVIASVRLRPGGTLADLVVDADPPRVMVPSGTVHVITLEARTTRAVVLHAARPVVVSRRVPRPACLAVRIGVKVEPRRFTTDFDAQPLSLRAQGADFPFSISATDVEQFWFEPIARTHEISWRLELDWTCAGRSGTTVIDNDGEPFEVYPVAALYDGRQPSALSSGCGFLHQPGCPSLLLEESGAATTLWQSGSSPLYPAHGGQPPQPRPDDDPEELKQQVLALDIGADPDHRQSWPRYRTIASLVRTLLLHPDARSDEPEAFRALLVRVLRYLNVSGQHHPATVVGRGLHADWARALGADHPDTLAAANRLAGGLIGLRKYEEAREVFADVLPRCERVLGEDHAQTLTVASNLGAALNALGAHQEARDRLEEVLRRSRRALGPDHPSTLRAAGNLVNVLRRLGDPQAARPIAEDTLARLRRTQGTDHPDTVHAVRTLTAVLTELGEDA